MSKSYDLIAQEIEEDSVRARRAVVAESTLKGAGVEEIRQLVFDAGIVSPHSESGLFSVGTIHNDLEYLRKMWATHAFESVNEHKTRVHQELQLLKKSAWDSKDVNGKPDHQTLLRALKLEAELFELFNNNRISGGIGVVTMTAEEWRKERGDRIVAAEKTMEIFEELEEMESDEEVVDGEFE